VRRRHSLLLALVPALTLPVVLALAVRGQETATTSGILLPGTQPEEGGIEFAKVQQCLMCHARTKNGDADPFFSWQGGMMAQAARDPVFRAALAVANQDVPGSGEYCIRCHAPRGWLEGRSGATDGSALNREDMHGVTCDVCHRLADPLSEEAKGLAASVPPGYGNAMIVADPANKVRGPYGDGSGAMPHRVMKSAYHASSELCANCHNVSNPLFADDVNTQSPHTYGHIERTYSEWALSDFPARGSEGTCQSCHYPAVPGGGQSSAFGGLHRDHFVMHGPVGGSTWVQDATFLLWEGKDMDRRALDVSKERARALLKTAAELDLDVASDGRSARLRITNLTGHKLPTGYPEGRRMWVNARYLDATGAVLGEIGRYGEKSDTLFGEAVTVPTLLDEKATRVYECKMGLSEAQAAATGVPAGPSFHFVLNDVVVKDNRIPPSGFTNDAFASHLCRPVGAEYADGQHWDEVELALPEGTRRVEVRLMFQSVSWEYLKFLAEENRSDDWGRKLYDAWTKTGRCPPEVMAEIAADVGGP
jgi:hypothetical protein